MTPMTRKKLFFPAALLATYVAGRLLKADAFVLVVCALGALTWMLWDEVPDLAAAADADLRGLRAEIEELRDRVKLLESPTRAPLRGA